MDKETLVTLLGIFGTLAGIIRWLLAVYFKKEAELEEVKKKLTDEVLNDLKETVENHKQELKVIKVELQAASHGYKSNEAGFKNLTESLRGYINSQEEEIIKIKGEIKYIRDKVDVLKVSRERKNGK